MADITRDSAPPQVGNLFPETLDMPVLKRSRVEDDSSADKIKVELEFDEVEFNPDLFGVDCAPEPMDVEVEVLPDTDIYTEWIPAVLREFMSCSAFSCDHCTTLNGNNGTWSGTDDVKGSQVRSQHDEREKVRRVREYHNRLKRKAGKKEIDRNDPDDMSERRVGAPKNHKNYETEPTSEAERPAKIKPETFLVKNDCDIGWDGSIVYVWSDGQFVSPVGVSLRYVPVGHRIRAVKSGFGFVVTEPEKGVDSVATACCTREDVQEIYSSTGTELRHDSYTVFWPLYNALRVKFPTYLPKTHTRNAAISLFESQFAPLGLPISVGVSTCNYFIAMKRVMEHEVVKNTPGYEPMDHELDNVYYCHDVGVAVNHEMLTVKNGVTCTLEDTYQPGDHFRVSMKGGKVDFFPDEGPIVYPQFNTELNDLAKYKRSIMFSFNGKGVEPFLLYDVNGKNACKAGKRTFATRDLERLYVHNQYRLGAYGFSPQSILRAMRVSIHGNLVVVGDNKHSHEVWIDERQDIMAELCGEFSDLSEEVVRECYQQAPHFVHSNQKSLVRRHHRDVLTYAVDSIRNAKRWVYYKSFDEYYTHIEPILGREFNASIPHVKRKLRMRYVAGARIHDTDDLMVNKLTGCVKKEMAKFGKVPRLFVSYGAGAMYANELPEFVKKAIDGFHTLLIPSAVGDITVSTYVIAKPKCDVFENCFSKIREAVSLHNHVLSIVYSDDSVYAGNVAGHPFLYNVDISSCDAGQRWPVFLWLYECLATQCPKLAEGLVKQCCLPIDVRNPSNLREVMTINFDGPFEGSGTVLTTILNSVMGLKISQMVGRVMAKQCGASFGDAEVEQCIRYGATLMGHKVTLESCAPTGAIVFEKAQLLKHSMHQCLDGSWTYAINYGTIYRSLGTVEGDLTHDQVGMTMSEFKTSTWARRMDRFVSTVIAGLQHEPSSCVLKSLRDRFSQQVPVETDAQRDLLTQHGLHDTDKLDRSTKVLDPESLARRYDCDVSELDDLANANKQIAFGWEYVNEAVAAFYRVDYGAPNRRGV